MPFNPELPFGERFVADNGAQAGLVSQVADFACDENPPQASELIGCDSGIDVSAATGSSWYCEKASN